MTVVGLTFYRRSHLGDRRTRSSKAKETTNSWSCTEVERSPAFLKKMSELRDMMGDCEHCVVRAEAFKCF